MRIVGESALTGVREIRKMSIRFVTVVGSGLVLWAIVSGQYVHALQFLRGISTGAGLMTTGAAGNASGKR